MILTTKARYATIAIVDMLESSLGNSLAIPTSLSSISARQNISLSFLEQIFCTLKKAGIVNSVKGPNGGYVLIKEPSKLNIADIIAAVNEPIKMTRCAGKSGCVSKKTRCKTHHVWQGLEKNIYNYLKSISLADVCKDSELIKTSSFA